MSENYDIIFWPSNFQMTLSYLSLGIPFGNCKGQGYDGRKKLPGSCYILELRFEDDNSSAISVQCLAHSAVLPETKKVIK